MARPCGEPTGARHNAESHHDPKRVLLSIYALENPSLNTFEGLIPMDRSEDVAERNTVHMINRSCCSTVNREPRNAPKAVATRTVIGARAAALESTAHNHDTDERTTKR